MGFGGRKFESPRPALQASLRQEDGRSSRKEKGQNRRAKYFPSQFDFKLAARHNHSCAIAGARFQSWF
jgi:hypothetical protein